MKVNDTSDVMKDLMRHALDCMAVAVSIIDTEGTLLYYNRQAAKTLDRKPEYIGTDIHLHHKRAASNLRVDQMFAEFRSGRTESFCYEAAPYGKTIVVTLSPIIRDGMFAGCVQTVRPKEEDLLKREDLA